MADEPKAAKEQGAPAQAPAPETPLPRGTGGKIVPMLIVVATVVVCAGAGFAMGRMFGARGNEQTVAAGEQAEPAEAKTKEKGKSGSDKGEPWFYDIEPIVANLNEPGVTRYVRVALTLEVGNGMAAKEGTEFLDQKKPLVKHWLTLYLSNQTIDGVRGEKNLKQVQTQIAEALNQGLFPNGKPKIVGVLFKELSIQ